MRPARAGGAGRLVVHRVLGVDADVDGIDDVGPGCRWPRTGHDTGPRVVDHRDPRAWPEGDTDGSLHPVPGAVVDSPTSRGRRRCERSCRPPAGEDDVGRVDVRAQRRVRRRREIVFPRRRAARPRSCRQAGRPERGVDPVCVFPRRVDTRRPIAARRSAAADRARSETARARRRRSRSRCRRGPAGGTGPPSRLTAIGASLYRSRGNLFQVRGRVPARAAPRQRQDDDQRRGRGAARTTSPCACVES